MKRFIMIVASFALVICLLSCSNRGSYEDGYSDGYIDGYSDAESDMLYDFEDNYYDGYDSGYSNGYEEGSDYGWMDNMRDVGRYFEEEAVYYARKHSEWHPEEAWMIIEAYQNNEPFYEDGSIPSKQDYLDAIDSLIYFYDYFYSSRYE